MRVSLKPQINTAMEPTRHSSMGNHTYKSIDMREQVKTFRTVAKPKASIDQSPEATRRLFSTGFVFKNSNSPIACDIRLSTDFQIKPTPISIGQTQLLTESAQFQGSPPRTAAARLRYDKPTVKEDFTFKTDFVGDVGWGVTCPNPFTSKERHVLKDQRHKWAYNHGQLRNNFQMETTGLHSEKVDTWLGLPYHQLDSLSVREQRKLVKQRVEQILQQKAQLHFENAVPLTRPIDTQQNTLLVRRQQERQFATIQSENKSLPSMAQTGTTAAQTHEQRDLASFSSSRRDDNFDFTSSSMSGGQKDFSRTHYLKRGCPKLLSIATRRKQEEIKTHLQNQQLNLKRMRTNNSVYERPKHNRMQQQKEETTPVKFYNDSKMESSQVSTTPKKQHGVLAQKMKTQQFYERGLTRDQDEEQAREDVNFSDLQILCASKQKQ